jgi:cell division septation protein DedD
VSVVSLVPVPTEKSAATCANCGAALVADQRYCLSCGAPASPVRLAFLDALQAEPGRTVLRAPTIEMGPSGYAPLAEATGAEGWLRRYSGVLGLLSVLLMCLIAGLLVGHWVTQGNSKAPAKQVVEVKGLSAAPAVAAASTTPTSTSAAPTTETPKETAKEKAEAAKEAAKETKAEKAPPPKPVKVAPTTIKKLTNSSGKKHQEEINALGNKPIETG